MGRRGSTESLGEILSALLQKRSYVRPLALASFTDAWRRAAGGRVADRTRVAAFRDGTLIIEVGSSAQRYELEAFQSRELLAALQADRAIAPVRKLTFRLGNPTT
jgi:predicted nucleic acid-binding Zn ribbon protein